MPDSEILYTDEFLKAFSRIARKIGGRNLRQPIIDIDTWLKIE